MSKGIYTVLASNSGKHDDFVTSTERLSKRLKAIFVKNMQSGNFEEKYESKATLQDIQQTHNVFVKNNFKPHVALAYEYFKTKKEGSGIPGIIDNPDTVRFNLLGNNGNFLNDMVVHVVFEAIGNPQASLSSYPKYRYCELPGIRLVKNARLVANGVEIDSYNTEDAVLYTKIKISASRSTGWNDMLGQENESCGEYYRDDISIKERYKFKDGAQTLRPYQKELNLWIPLIFDFNEYVSRSLHNQLIGTDQKYIELELAALNKIIKAENADGADLPNAIAGFRIKNIELYARNIYLPPEINDLYVDRKNLSLIRVKKQHRQIITTSSGSLLLQQLKYPIEIMYFGFRPCENGVNSNPYSFDDWHKMTFKTRKYVPILSLIENAKMAPTLQLVQRCASYTKSTAPMKLIGFTVHGNDLYPMMPEAFYNNYLPYILPGLSTPGEKGIYAVPWCLYPVSFDPSGHINNSTARELYIKYEKDPAAVGITGDSNVELFSSAQCLNFLTYDKTSIILKYAT